MLNCKMFEGNFSFSVASAPNLLTEISYISRSVYHSPDLKVSKDVYKMCIVKCKALLEDPVYSSNYPAVRADVAKLDKLLNDELPELEREESKFALAEVAEIVTEVLELIEDDSMRETKRQKFSNETDETAITWKHIRENVNRIKTAMQKGSTAVPSSKGATSTDSGYDDLSICTVEEALTKESDSLINLAVQVIKTEEVQSYTTHDNTIRSYFPCLVADKTGSVWLRVYQVSKRTIFKPQAQFMLNGLLKKTCEHPIWYISTTKLTEWHNVDVPQNIIDAAMKTPMRMSPPSRSLNEAVTAIDSAEDYKLKAVPSASDDCHIFTVKEALAKEPGSNINLDVQVIKTETEQSYKKHDSTRGFYFPCIVADKTGSVCLRVYQANQRISFTPKTTLRFIGLLRKSCEHPFWCVFTTKVTYCQSVDVPQSIIDAAMKPHQTWSPPSRSLNEAVTSNSQSTIVGKVTQLLSRDHINVVIDTIPEIQDPDFLADNDSTDDFKLIAEPSAAGDTRKRSNQQRLDDLLAEKDLCLLEKETQQICVDIKSFGPNIFDVYAAYKYPTSEPHAVAFIVTVKNDEVNLEHFAQYNIVKRTLHCYSNEGRDVLYSESNKRNRLKGSDEYRLKTSIEENETLLMQRHRYLSMISGSAVRSKGYKENHLIEPTMCLVLYVHAKGYVPIDETPFHDNYDGIAIDVREGGCWRFSNSINIGRSIRRGEVDKVGSIGGYFDLPSIGLCGITAAHVLLNDQEYEHCMEERRFTATGSQQEFRVHSSGNEDFGRITSAIYQEGNDNEAGFEVAIFHIERFHFGEVGTSFQGRTLAGDQVEYSFESGQILDNRHFYPDYKCCKYGSSSEFTMGELVTVVDDMGWLAIREATFDEQQPIVLRKQYEVKAFSEDESFSTFGDSGALVFCWRDPKELVCTGIIVGGTSKNTTIVSPIAPVLKRLGISKLKNFKEEKKERRIETLSTEVFHIKADVQTLHGNVDQLQSGMNILLQCNPPQTVSENRTSDQADSIESVMDVQ